MQNQPEQQPYSGEPASYTPPGYNAPAVPPYVPEEPNPAPWQQNASPAPTPVEPSQPAPYGGAPQFGAPQFSAPNQGPAQGSQPQFAPSPYGAPAPGAPQQGAPQYGAPPQFAQPGGPGYGAPTYYQGGPGYIDATSGPRGLSLASMIIGLVSLLLLGWLVIPQIVGVILGHMGLSKEKPQGTGFAITGLITNYLSILVWGGIWIFYIFIVAVSMSSYY